jgi:hypothetical protein
LAALLGTGVKSKTLFNPAPFFEALLKTEITIKIERPDIDHYTFLPLSIL